MANNQRKRERRLEIESLNEEGRQAYAVGKSRNAVPQAYIHNMNRGHWLYGWDDAESKVVAEQSPKDALLTQYATSELRKHWGDFTDADQVPEGFIERMEEMGFVELVEVTNEALEDFLCAERGIERGGLMWQLTEDGRNAYTRDAA